VSQAFRDGYYKDTSPSLDRKFLGNEEPRNELTRCGAFVYSSRGERIRTSDLLLPKQWVA
jgi:hypothetical protein